MQLEERKLNKYQMRKTKFKRMLDTEQGDSDDDSALKEGQSTKLQQS